MEHNLRWLAGPITCRDGKPLASGVTFGMPWIRGLCQPGQRFVIEEAGGQHHALDSREIASWADGSLKWTAHSVSADVGYSDTYIVRPVDTPSSGGHDPGGVCVQRSSAGNLVVSTRKGLTVTFSNPGASNLLEDISLSGRSVCSRATLLASIDKKEYSTRVAKVDIENASSARSLVKVSGAVVSEDGDEHLPFDIRVYIYSDADSVRIIHSFVHDLDASQPLTSLGLRFSVPLAGTEFHNRHVRLGGSHSSTLKEEVRGLSGLRHGPTVQNRIDQTAGQPVTLAAAEWARTELDKGLSCIPAWDSYTLSQLSSDGFTIKKRTKPGCSWVKVTGGGRADGTAYAGSARHGGLAVGMSDFWERYPTQLDITSLTKDEGVITTWLYSPLAEPLDTSPYHDGLDLDTYGEQLEGLDVTYEDYEPGFATANGIGRTNQFLLRPYPATPSNQELDDFSRAVRNPGRLVPTAQYMHSTGVFHGSWTPDSATSGSRASPKGKGIERNLDTLFSHYQLQVEQHRWYGFWDHGDIQHTYDPYRHAWRYDVGGFAWDNSELSTDLWLWLYFLHTGRGDVFRMAEAMTRHTGEVDVYHAGRFKGFGTRHGVQHFSDSSKQLRISNVLYRRIYFYLTGDERTGDLMSELQECQTTLLELDSHRKVQQHDDIPAGFAMTNIGLDCGALAASWLSSWERRSNGWTRSRDLLKKLLDGVASLKHGIANNAILFNPHTGEIRECPPPTPEWAISHLSMLFGFPEIITEVLDYARDEFPASVAQFKRVWLSYCRAYNGGPDVQRAEFGFEFPDHATWRQSHSTLTAMAAVEQQDDGLAAAAWLQFFQTDGYDGNHDWDIIEASPPEYFAHGEEAPWITTNQAARYGVSAIVNLANISRYLD